MANEYKTIKCKLDGKQSVSIPVDIKQNGRYVTEPLDVIIRGFLKFKESTSDSDPNELLDKTVVYPVLFTTSTIRINDGRCVITLLPRSEDLFEETESVVESASISDDTITSQGVSDDEQITDPDKNPVTIKIETGVIREPYKLSIEITILSVLDTDFYTQTVDRGTNPQTGSADAVTSLFQKETSRVPSNIIIDCYNDLDWVPSVGDILGSNNATREETIEALENLENSTPFGMSPMFDGVVASARILSDGSVDDDSKTIYVFTDNEANISKASLDNAIDEVNDIDGDKKVPTIIANMAVVEPTTLSIKANLSDTKNINKLSFLTGGQALTVTDDSFLDDIVGIFYREAVGAMGYGTYEFIADIGEEALINQITGFFDIPTSDTNATWSIETSLDGYNFTVIDDSYSHSESAEFENLYARYIRFKIILITAINSVADEYGATPESPALISVQILYNSYKIAYLYLNKTDVDIQPYQITLSVDANDVNDGQVEVGVAKSDAHSWLDFSTESQPSVDQNGKVVIPLRFSQNIVQFQQEPLAKVNAFTLKTKYGSFDVFATVLLYDEDNEVIPTNYYNLQPRNGSIVFNYALPTNYTDGDYKIGIINSEQYKIGLKLTNKTSNIALELYGIGYLYTTGKDLLPPLAKAIPEVQLVEIPGDIFNRFSVIEASYVYYDANFEPEDTSQRVIRWFINGSPISYLDNLTRWNDITDPADPVYASTSLSYPDDLETGETIEDWAKKQSISILSSGDKAHFEITVSDGSLSSSRVKSNVADIGESSPIMDQIQVMGEFEGVISSRLTADSKAVIYPPLEEVFHSDSDINQSEIIWYVNDEIFKSGIFGAEVPENTSPHHEIWTNDRGVVNYVDFGLRILNTIFVQVTPKTGDQVGTPITTDVVVVENSLPRIFNPAYVKSVHPENRDITLIWDFLDFEIHSLGDIDETSQYDRTSVKWYRKNAGETVWPTDPVYIFNDSDNNFRETFDVEEYRGHITTNLTPAVNISNTSIIDSSIVHVGQQFFAEIIPHDSLDAGTMVTTSIITITAAS